jgi:hypothetical protein
METNAKPASKRQTASIRLLHTAVGEAELDEIVRQNDKGGGGHFEMF